MLSASSRLLRLLSLLQARRHWAGPELAERLAVHPRTLRRDIDRLRGLGYPVAASSGVAGGYALRPGQALPPLLLDDDEALAVAIALRTAASGRVVGIEEPALQAMVKLEQLMPLRLRQRADALRSAVHALDGVGPSVDAALLTDLAGACRDQLGLDFDYVDAKGGPSRRAVEPQGVVHTGSRWYLVAWGAAIGAHSASTALQAAQRSAGILRRVSAPTAAICVPLLHAPWSLRPMPSRPG